MADIKNFGIKGIASDVQLGKSGGRLKYDGVNSRFDLTASDGATLENLRVGTIVAGTWNGDIIDIAHGGTGADYTAANGFLKFGGNGTSSVTFIDLTADVTGVLPVANGGTGATTLGGLYTSLGLGTIATQDAEAVSLTGGNIDGVVIGATTAAAGSFTTLNATSVSASGTISATSGFLGNLTGNVTGNVSGNAGTATALQNARDFSITGDVVATAVSFDGTGNVVLSAELTDTGVTAGSYGSGTAIPTFTVDVDGRITGAGTTAVLTSHTVSGDTGSGTLANGGTLSFLGTANQIVTATSGTTTTFSLSPNLIVNNVSVNGTLTSDDITSAAITVQGDATVTGNLTVLGTQTIVNTETVSIADAIIRVNSDGVAAPAGFEANLNGVIESLLYDPTASVSPDTNDPGAWVVSDDMIVSETLRATNLQVTGTIVGNQTGDLTGDVYSQDGLVKILENGTNGTDAVFTGSVTGNVTGNLTGNADTATTLQTARNFSASGDATAPAVSFDGSGNVDLALTLATVNANVGSFGSTTAIPTFTVDAKGRITAAGTAAITTAHTLAGDTGSSSIANGDTITIAGDPNITTSVVGGTATVALNQTVSVSTLNATNIAGGSITDGVATLTAGSLTGGVNGTFSGTVTGGTLTDGTATITGGAVSATSVTGGNVSISGDAISSTGSLTLNATGQILAPATYVPATADSLVDKGYVDQLVADSVGATLMTFGNGTSTSTVDLDEQTFSILGGSNLTASVSGQSLTLDLDTVITGLSSVTSTSFVGALTGTVSSLSNHTTDSLLEGQTNLYYTDTRARASLSGGTGVTYNSTSGVIAIGQDVSTTADVSFGNVTVSGNITGNVDTATALQTARNFSASGDATAPAVSFDGTGNVNLALTLADTTVTAGTYGSTTAIPTFTVDSKGRLTSAGTVTISTSIAMAGDNGTDAVLANGETLTFTGTPNQISTTVSDNQVTFALAENVSVTGSLNVGTTLDVTGNATLAGVNATTITTTGDAVIGGNLTVQGTTTYVNTETVNIADSILRVNSDGTAAPAGFEANLNGVIESLLYDPTAVVSPDTGDLGAWVVSDDMVVEGTVKAGNLTVTGTITGTIEGNAQTATALQTARDFSITGDVVATAVSFDGTGNVVLSAELTDTGVTAGSYGSTTAIPTFTVDIDGRITGAGTAAITTAHTLAGDTGTGSIANGDTITVAGGSNITTSVSGGVATVDLDNSISLGNVTVSGSFSDGIATLTGGDLSTTGNVTANAVQFGSLTDGVTAVTSISTSVADSDTALPTSGAVVDYVTAREDGLVLRSVVGSGAATFDVGTMPNVAGRTYYADKVMIKVTSAFAGGSFSHIVIQENGGAGTVIVAEADADVAAVGSFLVDLGGDVALTAGAAVTVKFLQGDGTTPATTTAGSMTVSVHYNWV